MGRLLQPFGDKVRSFRDTFLEYKAILRVLVTESHERLFRIMAGVSLCAECAFDRAGQNPRSVSSRMLNPFDKIRVDYSRF